MKVTPETPVYGHYSNHRSRSSVLSQTYFGAISWETCFIEKRE